MGEPVAGTMGRAAPEKLAANILRESFANDSDSDSAGNDGAGSQGELREPVRDTAGDTETDSDSSVDAGSTERSGLENEPSASADTDAPGDSGEVAEGEGQSNGKEGGLTLESLAEKLDMKVKDLYDLEIPMGDGEPMKLGMLKDLAAEAGDVKLAREQIELKKLENDNEIMAARAEMGQIVSMLGGQVTPQLLERARSEMNLMAERERRATLDAIPEWKDPDTYAREREKITDHLRGYGISQAEISTIHDHRILKMVADATRDRMKIKGALENATTIRQAPGKPGSTANKQAAKAQDKAALIQRAKNGNTQSKTAAVSALLSRE